MGIPVGIPAQDGMYRNPFVAVVAIAAFPQTTFPAEALRVKLLLLYNKVLLTAPELKPRYKCLSIELFVFWMTRRFAFVLDNAISRPITSFPALITTFLFQFKIPEVSM